MMNELPSQGVPTMMKTMGYSNQDPDYPLSARAVICGRDVVLVVGGGTRPHVGAAALAVSQPGVNDPTKQSTTASVITVAGHREDELARDAALRLGRALNTTVVVSVGIHIDDATREEIDILVDNYNRLLDVIEISLVDLFNSLD